LKNKKIRKFAFYPLYQGFTLVEMIVVIVITGIVGGMVAVFIKAPVQSYMDSGRRADMTDIADSAIRRIARDVRIALPNSVRLTTGACPGGSGTCDFLEIIPTTGSGRYRANATGGTGGCGAAGDELKFDAADTCFEVLGPMPILVSGTNSIAVFNQEGDAQCDAYLAGAQNRASVSSSTATSVTISSTTLSSKCASTGNRFQVISTPVSYVCDTTAGTLTRYSGYALANPQPTSLSGGNLLASKVGVCNFSYYQPKDLLTMNLGITDSGETVSLYDAIHVSNSSMN
jgi:MSHA biogenesis protein MshO